MSVLGPVLIAGFVTLMIWLANSDKTEQKILVLDKSLAFHKNLPDNELIRFYYSDKNLDDAIKEFYSTEFTCILYVPYNLIAGGNGEVKLFYKKSPGFATQQYVRDVLERKLYEFKLAANNIDPRVIHNARQAVRIINEKIYEDGNSKETKTSLVSGIGLACGILIFLFVFMYGMQVMRSVMEEKTNRIVEVIVSSVKPFELMMGKIIGVALVGLAQFFIWAVLTMVLSSVISATVMKQFTTDFQKQAINKEIVFKQGSNTNFKELEQIDSKLEVIEMMTDLKQINFVEVAICFVLYFLGGYLFYSAQFAAIGSAVDNEADTQQFMLPVTLPLTLGYVMAISVMQNPDGPMAFWGSIIPFTSPVVMLVRLPLGVPLWQILLSLSLLIGGFIFTTWFAGKIYRTGILMYGKKVTWKELLKWVSYKN